MNFQELYSKIRAIDENVAPVEECGEMAPMASMMGGAHPVPPQQDNISMNVSMNAQGTGGLRDLMAVLQAIEQGTDGTDGGAVVVHGTDDAGGSDDFASALDSLVGGEEEVSLGDKMADENMDMVPNDPDMNTGAPAPQPSTDDQSTDDQMASEEYQNEPNETYQSADYMTKTLAGGSDEPQHMKKHGYGNSDNPLGMKESLINELSNLYQEVKFREAKEKKMSRAAKGYEKYGKKGMQALAKAGKEGKDLDKVRDKYNKYDESLVNEWGVNLTQPQSDTFGSLDPKAKAYNDKANTNAMMAKYNEMIKKTQDEIAQLKADPSYGGATHDRLLKFAQERLDGLEREQMHNLTGTGVDDASNALRKQAIANNELTPGQWLQKATQYFKGKMTGQPQPGVSYDRYDTSKQAKQGWTTPTPYTPESINESADILKLAKMLRG